MQISLHFFQEKYLSSLTDVTKRGHWYYAANPNSRVQKDVQFQAFACVTTSVISDEEVYAYIVQTITHNKPPHPGRSWERRRGRHPNYFPPGRSS